MSEQTEKGSWPSETLPKSWSWAPFLEVFENVTSSDLKLKQKEYLESGQYPVVDQGEAIIGGYTDE